MKTKEKKLPVYVQDEILALEHKVESLTKTCQGLRHYHYTSLNPSLSEPGLYISNIDLDERTTDHIRLMDESWVSVCYGAVSGNSSTSFFPYVLSGNVEIQFREGVLYIRGTKGKTQVEAAGQNEFAVVLA